MLNTKFGKCIRFESKKLRVFKGRSSKGIRGINLAEKDTIVSLSIIEIMMILKKVKAKLKMKNLSLKQKKNLFYQLQKMVTAKEHHIMILELQTVVAKV